MNLWILTEEKPKASTITQILRLFEQDFNCKVNIEGKLKVRPLAGDAFLFSYIVENVQIEGIKWIYILPVSGSSSFFDFLVFKQDKPPINGCMDNLLMAIEETKTGDDESRNTGVYQRGSKFVHIKAFAPNVNLYMLYNDELGERKNKVPSDTSIFGTNIFLTLGVRIAGKSTAGRFQKFTSVDELISFKSKMRKPPAGNVPIDITKNGNTIYISGRLSKPADAGNIGHDPNIGALSMIAACIRELEKIEYEKSIGFNVIYCVDEIPRNNIIITQHGVKQSYADRNNKNKFFHIAHALGITLEGITFGGQTALPEKYWHYERKSEKIASVLLHVVAEYSGMKEVYQNHAGCERGYFKTPNGNLLVLPKKDAGGVDNLYLPDVVLSDEEGELVLLVEGKMLTTMKAGLFEIQQYGSIEREYINSYYPNAKIQRWLSIYGGNETRIPHEKVLIYVNADGKVYLNENAPKCIKRAFANVGL